MKNLTSPQAILCGLGLIALAIASVPYSSNLVKPALASNTIFGMQVRQAINQKCYVEKEVGHKVFWYIHCKK